MAISPVNPIGLGDLGGFGGVGSIGGLSGGASVKAAQTPTVDFAKALGKVQGSIDQADELSRQLATGELTDIHQYTVAASKAQLGVQLTVAMRNQMLSAFQEIMRMQI